MYTSFHYFSVDGMPFFLMCLAIPFFLSPHLTACCVPRSISSRFCLFHQHIINVSRTLILGLPWKQNGRPIKCITLQTLISSSQCGLQHLRTRIYGLLTMAMLAGLFMGVKDTSKVQNRRVAKLQIVFILIPQILILVRKFISTTAQSW